MPEEMIVRDCDKLISVIVPVYNAEDYLDRCVNSIIDQTYQNLEIILIDDGSTDKSYEMAQKWQRQDERIILIRQENQGAGAARNAGLQIASGDFIGFVDSDDYIDTRMYELLLDSLLKNEADVSVSGYDEDGSYVDLHLPPVLSDADEIVECFITLKINGMVWNKLYRRNIVDGLMFENRVINEDYVYICYLIERAPKIVYLPYDLYHYCVHKNSLIHSDSLEKYEATLSAYNRVSNRIDCIYKKESVELLSFHIRMFWRNSVRISQIRTEYGKNINEKEYNQDRTWFENHKKTVRRFFFRLNVKEQLKCIILIMGLAGLAFRVKRKLGF